MEEPAIGPATGRYPTLRSMGLLVAGVAIIAGVVTVVVTGGKVIGGGDMPVAGSGSAPPHTTYIQPVVGPANLGGTTWPSIPDDSDAAEPIGSDG